MQARRDWRDIFKVMKSGDLQPRLLYPAKLSFRVKGQIKIFPDKKKLKEYIITKSLLRESLRDLFKKKKKIKTMNMKMTTNSQSSTTESEKQTKQPRTETESWVWRAFWWLPDGRDVGE